MSAVRRSIPETHADIIYSVTHLVNFFLFIMILYIIQWRIYRIWQGRVSNPSERGTGGGEATDMRAARRRQAWGPPTENLKIYILSDSFSRHFRTLQTVCDMI